MDRPSIKKFLITRMCAIPNVEGLENNDINFLTPAGIISGKIYEYSDEDDTKKTSDILAHVTEDFTTEYKETYEVKSPLPENDGFIMLQDVKLRHISTNIIINLPQLTVFYDQITGIFLGNLSIDA
jgi:hypothetical protein